MDFRKIKIYSKPVMAIITESTGKKHDVIFPI